MELAKVRTHWGGADIKRGDSARMFFERFKAWTSAMPAESRPFVQTLWADVRTRLQDLETEVERLEAQKRSLEQTLEYHSSQEGSTHTVQRPGTSETVRALRQSRVEERDAKLALSESEGTVQAIKDLPQIWARARLAQYRDQDKEKSLPRRFRSIPAEKGGSCWAAKQESGHRNGYIKLNLRNTVGPTGQKIGVSPWAHQLAAVAAGQGSQLPLTTKGEYHVSHLCHNAGCINPDHVIIEPAWINEFRKFCAKAWAVRFPDGSFLDPCRCHVDGSPRCLIPTWYKPDGAAYYIVSDDGINTWGPVP